MVATCVPPAIRTASGWGGEPEGDLAAGRRRREEANPDQLQELDVVAVRDPVETVEKLVRHPGERLDQGDTRVRDVVVGPFRAVLLDEPLRVVDEVLEAAVVQVRDRQGHRSILRGDHVEGEDEVPGIVRRPDRVADVDVERRGVVRVGGHVDLLHGDPGLPSAQRGAHVDGDPAE
jgi:hypothetical protein